MGAFYLFFSLAFVLYAFKTEVALSQCQNGKSSLEYSINLAFISTKLTFSFTNIFFLRSRSRN